jgi:protein-tyrosine phosphatase
MLRAALIMTLLGKGELMIDIHTHILPQIDDGSKDKKEALALISLLKKQGVTKIVLTPHFYPHLEKLPDFLKRREIAYRSIEDADTELILGSETYLSEPLLSLDSIEDLCIGRSGYLLLELPLSKKWTLGVYKQIDYLIAKFNICPVIAHAERYEAVQKHTEEIFQRLVDLGCMLQFNTDSVANKWTRTEILRLMKEGWADFIGSDCHNVVSRAPQFDVFCEIVEKKLGTEYLCKLTTDSQDIIK